MSQPHWAGVRHSHDRGQFLPVGKVESRSVAPSQRPLTQRFTPDQLASAVTARRPISNEASIAHAFAPQPCAAVTSASGDSRASRQGISTSNFSQLEPQASFTSSGTRIHHQDPSIAAPWWYATSLSPPYHEPLPYLKKEYPDLNDASGYLSGHQNAPPATFSASATQLNSPLQLQGNRYISTASSFHPAMAEVEQPPIMPVQHTPVSPVNGQTQSPNDNATLPELLSRKRSHTEMQNGEPDHAPTFPQEHQMIPEPYPNHGHIQHQHQEQPEHFEHHEQPDGQHSRGESEGQREGSPHGDDYTSPRGSRSFKRGDPPVNAENKYFCNFAEECAGQTFDRKCEWR